MKSVPRRQEGATLLMVTLFTLIFLTMILYLTSTMVVRGTRTTSDQRTTVVAQYAAETGRAYIDQRLSRTMSIFAGQFNDSGAITQRYMAIPPTKTRLDILALVNQFCANSSWTPTTLPSPTGSGTVNVSQCVVPPSPAAGYAATDTQFDIFSSFYAPVPAITATSANYPFPAGTPDTLEGRRAYWNQLFGKGISITSSMGASSFDAFVSLTPTRAVQISNSNFRLYLKPNVLRSVGKGNGGTRLVKANATTNSEFYVTIQQPPFSRNVLFTNHHRNKAGNNITFSTQQFDGPVHTNENFTFQTGSAASFTQLSSAGCNFPSLTSNDCSNKSMKVVIGGSTYSNPPSALAANTNVTTTQSAVWDAAYLPMPTNNQDQQAAATANGLLLNNISSVTLKAGAANEATPTTYDPNLRVWTPAPQYQYITTTSTGGVVTTYRYGSDNKLYRKDATTWTLVQSNFNGVIYSASTAPLDISGPGRNGAGQSLPAFAPFAGITVAGNNNLNIKNDLTYSDVPCNPAEACYTAKPMPKNIFGLYTQSGDITIDPGAPNDLNIHGSLMTSTGEVTVTGYNSGSPRGNVNLLGGLIENYYGAFGKVSGNTPVSGYGRNFSFDQRMDSDIGMTPPYFALAQNWEVTGSNRTSGAVGTISLLNLFWNQDKQ